MRQLAYTLLTFLATSASCSKTWRRIRLPGLPSWLSSRFSWEDLHPKEELFDASTRDRLVMWLPQDHVKLKGAGLVCGRGLFEWHARNLKNIRAKITAKCRKIIVTFRKPVSQFWTLVQLCEVKDSNLWWFQGVLSRSLSSGENRSYFSINQACRAAVSWKPSVKLSKMAVVSEVGISVCWSVRY